jgi:hypothetical protein
MRRRISSYTSQILVAVNFKSRTGCWRAEGMFEMGSCADEEKLTFFCDSCFWVSNLKKNMCKNLLSEMNDVLKKSFKDQVTKEI